MKMSRIKLIDYNKKLINYKNQLKGLEKNLIGLIVDKENFDKISDKLLSRKQINRNIEKIEKNIFDITEHIDELNKDINSYKSDLDYIAKCNSKVYEDMLPEKIQTITKKVKL